MKNRLQSGRTEGTNRPSIQKHADPRRGISETLIFAVPPTLVETPKGFMTLGFLKALNGDGGPTKSLYSQKQRNEKENTNFCLFPFFAVSVLLHLVCRYRIVGQLEGGTRRVRKLTVRAWWLLKRWSGTEGP
ncbi:hypothetical protein E1A91_A09G064900v1 [Gossypium mustelinum]|uniref:Uncharacterized protein n=1 Tax=Gossypium mustelinum TaxID=34275 RepID=A0A5D2XU66_GOSMU|nr:hypothetical protein E1A91_A09G064900v1 [Gossypium mustelinum]